jgi:hypothetical protein
MRARNSRAADLALSACLQARSDDAGINPAWTAVTGEDGKQWPVRDFHGTFDPECRRYPPLQGTSLVFPLSYLVIGAGSGKQQTTSSNPLNNGGRPSCNMLSQLLPV